MNFFSSKMSEKEVARWLKASKRGKWHFVLKVSLKFAVAVFIINFLLDWYDGRVIELFGFRYIVLILFSPIIGLMGWWDGDSKYKNHVLDRKIEKGLSQS